MAKEMIRIRLKAYDHQVIDQSAEKIVETARAIFISIYKIVKLYLKISKTCKVLLISYLGHRTIVFPSTRQIVHNIVWHKNRSEP